MAGIGTHYFGAVANQSQSYFQAGARHASMYNMGVAQTHLSERIVDTLEPKLQMYRFGRMESIVDGYATHAFARSKQIPHTAFTETTTGGLSANTNTIGMTPAPTDTGFAMITVQPRQWVIRGIVSDMVQMFNVVNFSRRGLMEFVSAGARLIDNVIQEKLFTLSSVAGNLTIIYNGTGTAPTTQAGITNTNKADCVFKFNNLADLRNVLVNRYAEGFARLSGSYVLVANNNVTTDILKDEGQNQFTDIMKHTPEQVRKIVKGYVGTGYGVSVIESNFIQTKDNGQTGNNRVVIYPSYLIGEGLFGVLKYRVKSTMIPHTMPDKSDPAGQRNEFALNIIFNTVILDVDCGQVVLSTATATN